MSFSSRITLTVIEKNVTTDLIFMRLLEGCWVDENQRISAIKENMVLFKGGLDEANFRITLENGELIIEADNEWEMVLLSEELKDLAVNEEYFAKTK